MRIRVRRLEIDERGTIAGVAIVRRNHDVKRRVRRDSNWISNVHAHHQRNRQIMIVQVRQIRPIGYQVSICARAGPTQKEEAQTDMVYVTVCSRLGIQIHFHDAWRNHRRRVRVDVRDLNGKLHNRCVNGAAVYRRKRNGLLRQRQIRRQ